MGKEQFTDWLFQEIVSAQMDLLCSYEQLEDLRSVQAPRLQQEYMIKFGPFEEQVLECELEALLLQKKLELIQRKLNRREPVDLEEIEQTLATARTELMQKLETKRLKWTQRPALSDNDLQQLQAVFHRILHSFQPQLHPDLTQTERQLYDKALQAYRNQDLTQLLLIQELLFEDNIQAAFEPKYPQKDGPECCEDTNCFASSTQEEPEVESDFSLAQMLYPYFIPLEQELILNDALQKLQSQQAAVQEEIDQMLNSFPMNIRPVLEDPDKAAAGLEQLQQRLLNAQQQCRILQLKLDMVLEDQNND